MMRARAQSGAHLFVTPRAVVEMQAGDERGRAPSRTHEFLKNTCVLPKKITHVIVGMSLVLVMNYCGYVIHRIGSCV